MKTTHELINITSDKLLPRNIWEWLLLPFIIGIMTLSLIEGLSKIMVLYGILLSWLFLIYFLYQKLKLQPEVILFFVWLIWSIIGLITVIDLNLYAQNLKTIIQMAVLIFTVAGITALNRNLLTPMLAIALGGAIVLLSGYFTGDFQIASDINSRTRAMGLAENANEFAYLLLFLIFAIFFFWEIRSSLGWRVLFLTLVTFAVLGIIYSGSRKIFLTFLAFISLWFLFCQSKKFFKNPIATTIILMIVSISLFFAIDYVMSNTYLGERFKPNNIEHGSESRIQMYKDGFNMIREHPIFGVGLNNYRRLSTSGLYSHSDYIEVAANTGIIGFLLYFSIYIVLWRRLSRIQAMINESHLLYIIGLLKAIILTILLVAFGKPNITSKLTWLFLAAAIGYSWSIERIFSADLKSKQLVSENNNPTCIIHKIKPQRR